MSTPYDLHTHSTASDGVFSPSELVTRAHSLSIKTLAVTDHDTVAGLDAAQQTAASLDIHVINGIELSTRWQNQTIHVVGLQIDPSSPAMIEAINRLQNLREERAVRIGEQLEKSGISDAYQNALRLAAGGTVTRQHFSRFLVEGGHATNQTDVFKRYLVRNKPGYVSVAWPELNETINCIREAGGIAVIAHPLRYKMTAAKLRRLIVAFKEGGGQAIEVITGHDIPSEIKLAADYARKYEIAASVGSDFHNESTAWGQLGQLQTLPPDLTPVWQLW